MCEITYETKEYAYLSILYFHIEKRENGVLMQNRLSMGTVILL